MLLDTDSINSHKPPYLSFDPSHVADPTAETPKQTVVQSNIRYPFIDLTASYIVQPPNIHLVLVHRRSGVDTKASVSVYWESVTGRR